MMRMKKLTMKRLATAAALSFALAASIATSPPEQPAVQDTAEDDILVVGAEPIERLIHVETRGTTLSARHTLDISFARDGETPEATPFRVEVEIVRAEELGDAHQLELLSEIDPDGSVSFDLARECDQGDDEESGDDDVCSAEEDVLVRLRRTDDGVDEVRVRLGASATIAYDEHKDIGDDDRAKVTIGAVEAE